MAQTRQKQKLKQDRVSAFTDSPHPSKNLNNSCDVCVCVCVIFLIALSEGRGNGKEKFWSSIFFSLSKEKEKKLDASPPLTFFKEDNKTQEKPKQKQKQKRNKQVSVKKAVNEKPANGISKRRVLPSAHEFHYTANRAQAEEMKKRTCLPYRQGLFGCLGFSSKGYGALN